jgi:hypothetical protein
MVSPQVANPLARIRDAKSLTRGRFAAAASAA